MSSSVVEQIPSSNECEKNSSSSQPPTTLSVGDEGQEDDASNNEIFQQQQQQVPKQIIRYSTSTLFALRSSKLSQQKPACKNMDLSCMAHYKPPPKMLIANMMPKFALNQMPNARGEESISPLSFHSNSSSSSNLSYQKRYQDGGANGGEYNNSNSRYYYNKYKSHDEIGGSGSNGSSRIIYKTTGANASNGNSIRFLKKAYSSKYEDHHDSAPPSNSLGLISNKNILDNASRVITAADHRNLKKKLLDDDEIGTADDAKAEKKSPTDEANNNINKATEVNANDLMSRNDLNKKRAVDDITNNLDDIFNDLSLNQLLDDKITEERESSRFSKWFNRGNDESELAAAKNESNNNNNAGMFQHHETEKYFQPIDKMEHNSSLFDMLKGGQSDPLMNMMHSPISQPKPQKSPGNSGHIHSVEELEAKMRHHKSEEEQKGEKVLQNFFQQQLMPNLMQQQQQQTPQMHNQNQEEINAFKKLLSQMAAEDQKIPMMTPNGQQPPQQQVPNMLQQLMNKNFQQDIMIQQQQFQKTFPNMGANQGIKSPGGTNKMINHMIPQQPPQFGGNLDLKFLQQQPKIPAPLPEIVKRPEVQALVQELTSGEISQYNLWQRLTAPGLSPIEREIITCALNIFNANSNNGNATNMFAKQQPHNLFQPPPPQANPNNAAAAQRNFLTAPIPIPPQASPLSPVPPLDQHLLFQHQAAAAAVAANKQLRLSPLPAGFSMGPTAVLPPNNTLTLHVPGMPQRIPSPRELQYHTQSIMQNALIRKKLEEQRENYRKRQEQEKQENAKKNQQDLTPSSSSSDGTTNADQIITTSAPSMNQQDEIKVESPTKKAPIAQQSQQRQHAPSPSIFTLTPTSVLRKMTAEKESDASKNEKKKLLGQSQNNLQQQAMRNPPPQQSSQQQPPPFMSQMDRLKMAQNDSQGMQFGNINSWNAPSMQDMKPIGRPIVKSSTVPAPNQPQQPQSGMMNNFDFQQQQKMQNIQKAQFLQMQMKKQQMDNPVLSQFMAQQQQRAVQAQSQFRQFPQQQMNFSMMQSGRTDKPEEQMENRNMMNNGGCLSPTSNQLAKWFSPELLADASAGKLLPSLSGQMLSLEELEKCMQNS